MPWISKNKTASVIAVIIKCFFFQVDCGYWLSGHLRHWSLLVLTWTSWMKEGACTRATQHFTFHKVTAQRWLAPAAESPAGRNSTPVGPQSSDQKSGFLSYQSTERRDRKRKALAAQCDADGEFSLVRLCCAFVRSCVSPVRLMPSAQDTWAAQPRRCSLSHVMG